MPHTIIAVEALPRDAQKAAFHIRAGMINFASYFLLFARLVLKAGKLEGFPS
jgi:hypothetical protein